MKKIVTVLFLASAFSTGSCQRSFPTSSQFNEQAKEFFLEQYETLDLTPMDELERCILKEAITKYLDTLDNSKIVIVHDRFLVKNFYEPWLEMPFSFVKDAVTNRFYFFCLPEFHKMIYDVDMNYELSEGGKYKLKAARGAKKIASPMINVFFSDFNRSEGQQFYSATEIAKDIIHAAFPDLLCAYEPVSVVEWEMRNDCDSGLIAESALEEIVQLLNPSSSDTDHDTEAYFIDSVGYLFVIYCLSNPGEKVEVSFYLVPEVEGSFIDRPHHHVAEDRNCLTRR